MATDRPRGLPVAEFAESLRLTRGWIRAEDPQAQIVLPGLLGTYGFPFANSTNWLNELLTAGGGDGFDVANYHDYNSWWTLPFHYDQVRATLDAHGRRDMPIWVTETGISSRKLHADYARLFVARRTSRRCLAAARPPLRQRRGPRGLAFPFLHLRSARSRYMGPVRPARPHRRKEKTWHAMKLLIAKLEGFKQAKLVSPGDARGGYNLTGLAAGTRLFVTRVVPTAITADGHSATFDTSIVTANDGEHTFTLGDFPILVEPVPSVELKLEGQNSLHWRNAATTGKNKPQ